jgi:hypothetical protein
MNIRKVLGTVALALSVALCLMSMSFNALAQSSDSTQANSQESKDDETNLDTQLYLIVATNQDVDTKLPASLDLVIKQLRASLPFKNYRLAATLVNRVKNEGRLDLRWVGGAFAAPLGSASQVTPSFSEFKVRTVKLVRNTEGQPVVQMAGFSYGARIPIQTGTALASNGPTAAPVINYESTGLNTDISMREGEPVVVGTLNAGPSGDAIILVVSAKRTLK